MSTARHTQIDPGLSIRDGRLFVEDCAVADLDTGSSHILELLQYLIPQGSPLTQEPCDPGSGHIALRMGGVVATLERLRQGGVTARADLVEIPGPAAWRGARCVYVQDPDGVTVELIERPDPARQ